MDRPFSYMELSVRQYHTLRRNLLRIEEIGTEEAIAVAQQIRKAVEIEGTPELDVQKNTRDLIRAAGDSGSEEVRKRAASVADVVDAAIS